MKFIETLLLKSLKRGAYIPKSVAFIMDGNRRYAESKLGQEKHEGHKHGHNRMVESMIWCNILGIKEVSVFALSIDNLKRPKKEVDTLLHLAKKQFVSNLELF